MIARWSGVRLKLVAACVILAASLGFVGAAQALEGWACVQTELALSTVIETGGFVGLGRVTVVSENEVWALADAGLVLYDGESWTATDLTDHGTYLTAIDHFGQSVWVATHDCRLGRVVDRRMEFVSAPWPCTLADLVATGGDSVVAVGRTDAGRGLFLFYDGGDWRRLVVHDVLRLSAIDLGIDGQIWAGGNGDLVALVGETAFVHRDLVAGCYIFDLELLAPNGVWISGKCGESASAHDEGRPFIARYDGSELRWEDVEVLSGVWWIGDIDFVNETLGWAVAQGWVIYGYDGTAWSVREDFHGGMRDSMNAVAIIDAGHAFFTASTGDPIEYIDGEFNRFLGQRSRVAPLGDYGMLTSLAVTESGEGWSVGLGGPVMHRLAGTEHWIRDRDVPHGERMVSVGATAANDVWFGSYGLPGSGPSKFVHYEAGAYTVHQAPTELPIWDLTVKRGGVAWAVASTMWLAPTIGERRSELMQWDGTIWRLVATIAGEELVAVDSRDGRTVLAVGTGVFECSPDACARVRGFDDYFVRDVMFSSSGHGYAVAFRGGPAVFEYESGSWQRDLSFDATRSEDLPMAVYGDQDCAVVTARQSAYTKVNGRWQPGVIPVATGLGEFDFAAIAGYGFGRGMPYWASGEYSTVVRGTLCDATGSPAVTATSAPTTTTPTPTQTPRSVMLPLCLK